MPRTTRWIPVVLCLAMTTTAGWTQETRDPGPPAEAAFVVHFVKPFADEVSLSGAAHALAAEYGGAVSQTIGRSAAVLILEPAAAEEIVEDRRIAWVRRDGEVSPRWMRAAATCNGSPETTEAIPELFEGKESIRLSRAVATLGARGHDVGESLRGRCGNRENSARVCVGDCICRDGGTIYMVPCDDECWSGQMEPVNALEECWVAEQVIVEPPKCHADCDDLGVVRMHHQEGTCCKVVDRRECAERCDD